MDYTDLDQNRQVTGSFKHGNKRSVSLKVRNSLTS
jgi:hypothetical protein